MSLLAGFNYDPGTAVTHATTTVKAMAAFRTADASFPQVSFTVPSNGAVLVRLRSNIHGGTGFPQVFLGVMNGATVVARVTPNTGMKVGQTSIAASHQAGIEALFVVSGLTPGASLTWDAAYGVDVLFAGSGIKYGGPNNTTTNDAFGGFVFEVWEASNLIANVSYDPSGTKVAKSISALLAMTALDTTNLRITNFTVPASGNVLVRLRGNVAAGTQAHAVFLGVLQSTTVIGRQQSLGGCSDSSFVTWRSHHECSFVVTGLTPGASLTWDAAYGVEVVGSAGQGFIYGGPNDTTSDNAGGAFSFELWAA